jgi:hypothetical protein
MVSSISRSHRQGSGGAGVKFVRTPAKREGDRDVQHEAEHEASTPGSGSGSLGGGDGIPAAVHTAGEDALPLGLTVSDLADIWAPYLMMSEGLTACLAGVHPRVVEALLLCGVKGGTAA